MTSEHREEFVAFRASMEARLVAVDAQLTAQRDTKHLQADQISGLALADKLHSERMDAFEEKLGKLQTYVVSRNGLVTAALLCILEVVRRNV